MKRLSCLVALLTLVSFSLIKAQTDCDAIYATGIIADGANLLNLLVDGPAEVEKWDKDYIRVTVAIKSNLGKRHIVKYLARKGRYKFEAGRYGDIVELSMPNLRKIITVNRQLYRDELVFTFQVPRNMEVNEIGLPLKMIVSK